MANLETLELTINGSAEGAKTGISGLITSLSALSGAVGKSVGGLKKLNAELRELKKYGKIKLPSLASISGSAAAKAAKKAKNEYDPLTNNNRAVDVSKLTYPGAVPKEKYDKDYQEAVEQNKKQIELNRKIIAEARVKQAEEAKIAAAAARAREQEAISMMKSGDKIGLMQKKLGGMTADYVKNAREGKLSAKQMADGALQINNLQDKILKAEEEAKNAPTVFQQLKSGVGNAFKSMTDGAGKFFGRIKKIATTMLIRSAIRGLIKSVKEGINNLYEWSKLNNGEFAKSLDTLHAKTAQLKNSIGASIAPVIQAALPAINALANAAITAFNYVNQLIALLTGQSYWTKAADGANEYAEAASGAGSAAKEWLASFDELNVMNSSGGGGGGGGVAGQFDDMFENVTKFDENIREIADFLKNNFETIKAIALEIGAAILAWKLGNAFAETLPTLSKIMGFAATGLTIAITLQADWILTNQYLDTGEEGWLLASMLTTAVGSTAAWVIAKQLIGGKAGYYAASITLAANAITDIIANVKHTNVSAFSKESILTNIKAALEAGGATGVMLLASGASTGLVLAGIGGVALITFTIATLLKIATQDHTSLEWGNFQLTDEQKEKFVKQKMFTIEPDTIIKITSDSIQDIETDSEAIATKLRSMLGYLEVVELGLATSDDYAHLKSEILDPGGLLDSVSKWINDANTLDKRTLKIIPELFGKTKEEQGEWYKSDTAGWNAVQTFMQDLGVQLADQLVVGEGGEITAKRSERVAKLLDEITRISEIIAGKDIAIEKQIDFELELKDLNQNSFQDAVKLFDNYKTGLEGAAESLAEQMLANKVRLVESLKEMLAIDPNNAEIQAKLTEAENGLAELRNNWDTVVKNKVDEWSLPGKNMLQEWFNNQEFTIDMNSAEWLDLFDDFGDNLNGAIEEAVKATDPYLLEVADILHMSGWDLLEDESKKSLIKALGGLTNSDTVLKLKNQLNLSAQELFGLSDWNSFTNTQKFEFLNAINEAYGSSEAIAAAKAAGVDIGKLIAEGLGSSDSTVRKQAETWNSIIAEKVEVKHPVWVTQTVDKVKAVGNKITEWLTGTIDKKNHNVPVSAKKADVDKVGTAINSTVTKKRYANVALSDSAKTQLNTALQKAAGTTNVNVKANVQLNNANKLTQAVQNALEKVNWRFSNVAVPKAAGGFVPEGQLFLAREAGAEMVGSIGNRTAVANNDQIVKGISSGVAAANEEQNELLRRQNQILMGILQKTGSSGMPGASAAMGRVIQQSLEMYSAVTGG